MVTKLSDMQKASPQRTAAMAKEAKSKIVSAAKVRADFIASIDGVTNKLSRAYKSKKFTKAEVRKVLASLSTVNAQIASHEKSAMGHMTTALALSLPTNTVVAQIEDLAALKGKVAVLHTVAKSTIAGEDEDESLLQLDDAGYVVSDDEDVLDALPQAPEVDQAPTADNLEPMASRARKTRADVYEGDDYEDGEHAAEPVGTPKSEGPVKRSGPEPQQTSLPPDLEDRPDSYEMSEHAEEPVGSPNRKATRKTQAEGQGNGELVDDYSRHDPSEKPPSSTVSRMKRAEEDSFDPEPKDMPVAKKKASELEETPEYSRENPKKIDETVKGPRVKATKTKAEDETVEEPGWTPDEKEAGKVKAKTPIYGDPRDESPEGDFTASDEMPDDLSDEHLTDDLAADDALDIELPQTDDFDDLIQDELLADTIPGLDADEDMDDDQHPEELTASVRAARRLTASRSAGAAPSSESDLLRSMIDQDFR